MRHLWIKIDGSLYETPEGHDKWASSKVLRFTGTKPQSDPSEIWQKLTGDIKVTLDDNSIGFTIHRGITRNQLKAMKALADSVGQLGYEIYTYEGPPSYQENGPMPLEWDVFVGYLRKLQLLHESIKTSPEGQGKKLGLVYNGPMKRDGNVAFYMFTDPKTKTTFSVRPQGDVELELKKARRRFGVNERYEVIASYWIYPDGKVEKVSSHARSAAKMLGEKYTTIHSIYDAMDRFRLVRSHKFITSRGVYMAFESLMMPTPEQKDSIRELSAEANHVDYEGFKMDESLIDYPKNGLSSEIWYYENGTYKVRPKIKRKIFLILQLYPEGNLHEIEGAEYHITGSIATNQYQDDTDIDIHIVVPEGSSWDSEKVQKDVFRWYKKNREEIGAYVYGHPIEVYIQRNPSQEFLSDGVYDLVKDKWLKGPTIVSFDFDPYEEFEDILDDVIEEAEKADILLGELKRDVIDYNLIKSTIQKRLPKEVQKKLLSRLQIRAKEIEDDIEDLYKLRGEWVGDRKSSSQPTSVEQALKDVELAKSWRDKNAIFKFLNRYNYLKLIEDLYTMIEDNSISNQDVNVIRRMIGV